MLAAGASDRDGEVTFPLAAVFRNQKREHLCRVAQKGRCFIKAQDIITNRVVESRFFP